MDTVRADASPQITTNSFEILLALAGGDKHGYAIMQDVNGWRNGQRLGPGTLYRSIKQLHEAGLIEESGQRADPDIDDERRRYYRLTRLGRRALRGDAARLAKLVEGAANLGLVPKVVT